MNPNDPEMNPNLPDMNPHDLDQQIRAALQVERAAGQLARLECFWQRQSAAQRRRRRMGYTAALATAVAVALSVSIWIWRQGPAQKPLEANRPADVAPATPDPNHAAVPDPNQAQAPQRVVAVASPDDKESLSAGRPPTTYERFILVVGTHKAVATNRPSAVARIDEVIEQLIRDPHADAEQLAQSSGLMELDAERLLLRRLPRSTDDEKHAVVRLLAVCGTPRSTPQLLRLGQTEAFRDEALATIERIAGIQRMADVLAKAADRSVRAAIFRRLLTADSEPALRLYLSLVGDDAVRDEALAVADAVPQRSLAALLARLDDEDEAVRLSAALVLGHANGPEVTNSLIVLVTREPPSPVEAWIALVACRGEQAEEFFAYATRQPQFLGRVNRARMWWARMTL